MPTKASLEEMSSLSSSSLLSILSLDVMPVHSAFSPLCPFLVFISHPCQLSLFLAPFEPPTLLFTLDLRHFANL
jgi:hypothetical protein